MNDNATVIIASHDAYSSRGRKRSRAQAIVQPSASGSQAPPVSRVSRVSMPRSRHTLMYIFPVVGDDGDFHGFDHFVAEWWNCGKLADREIGQYFDVYWAPGAFWCNPGDEWVPRGKVFHDWVHDRWYWPGTQEQKPYGPWWGSGKGTTPPHMMGSPTGGVGKGKTSADDQGGKKGKHGKNAVDDGKGKKGMKATDGKGGGGGGKGKKGKFAGGDGKGKKGKSAAAASSEPLRDRDL